VYGDGVGALLLHVSWNTFCKLNRISKCCIVAIEPIGSYTVFIYPLPHFFVPVDFAEKST
jgi:hypothetical protein